MYPVFCLKSLENFKKLPLNMLSTGGPARRLRQAFHQSLDLQSALCNTTTYNILVRSKILLVLPGHSKEVS